MARTGIVSILLAFGLFSVPVLAVPAPPYHPGEKTSFSITYFGATAGILDLEVQPSVLEGGRKLTELSAKARTDSIFALFYSLKNLYRSSVDSVSGLPIRFVITHDETKFGGSVTQEFDHTKKKVTHLDRRIDRKESKNLEKTLVREIPAGTQDVVSVFFHLRALPLSKGKKFDVPVFIGEESCLLRLDVVEEETISTKIGEMPAYVVKPVLLKDGKEVAVPDTFIWISKAENRALLKIKAKVKIGSVVAYLRSYSPGNSLVPAGNSKP